MKNRIYQLFQKCFPNLPVCRDVFFRLFDYETCKIITKDHSGQLIGFSAVQDNSILLLCIDPKFQGLGFGTQLVKESEDLIRLSGYSSAILGGTDSKLFLGAPTAEAQWREQRNHFFETCGYSADDGCLEMIMPLSAYRPEQLTIPLDPPGITFGYWDNKDKSGLLAAVGEVEADWVKYFRQDVPIYAAMEQNRCVGFTILSFNDDTLYSNGRDKVGMVGCVGVIPDRRSHGIGLAMVAHATHELKKRGSDLSYIHHTYLDKWYGRLGYQSFLFYWFGHKAL